MGFNPDQYLAEKKAVGNFDPDKYLAEKGGNKGGVADENTDMFDFRREAGWLGRAADYAGGASRYALAGLANIPYSIATGKSLTKTDDVKGLLGEGWPTTSDYLERAGVGNPYYSRDIGGFVGDVALDPLTYLGLPGARLAAKEAELANAAKFGKPSPAEVTAAAEKLGVKPTRGMISQGYIEPNLENSLSQQPTLAGSLIRKEYEPIHDIIGDTAKKATADAAQESAMQAGRNIKSDLTSSLKSELEPISKSYNEIQSHTKNIPINQKGLERIANNIRKMPEAKFSGSDGNQVATRFADWLSEVKSVDDIKDLLSKAKAIARDHTASADSRRAASAIIGKLEQAQSNTITRQAIQIAKESPIDRTTGGKFLNKSQKAIAGVEAEAEGADIGRKLVSDIKDTNKKYRSLMEDVRKLGKGSGLTKGKNGMSVVLDEIEKANPQDAAHALFDSGNIEFTQFVKQKFPRAYETARQQRLAEVAAKAGDSPKRLLTLVQKMTPEERSLLFGEELSSELTNADTLARSLPKKVGASDTPRGHAFQWDVLNPVAQGNDLLKYGLLKAQPVLPSQGLIRSGVTHGLLNKKKKKEDDKRD